MWSSVYGRWAYNRIAVGQNEKVHMGERDVGSRKESRKYSVRRYIAFPFARRQEGRRITRALSVFMFIFQSQLYVEVRGCLSALSPMYPKRSKAAYPPPRFEQKRMKQED